MGARTFNNVISIISDGENHSRSSWYVQIPTLAGGIVAHVLHNHRTGALWVACADDLGVWYRSFEDAESYAEWLDFIRAGEVAIVTREAMPPRHWVATFKPAAGLAA